MISLLCFLPHTTQNAPQSVPRLYTGNGQVKTLIPSLGSSAPLAPFPIQTSVISIHYAWHCCLWGFSGKNRMLNSFKCFCTDVNYVTVQICHLMDVSFPWHLRSHLTSVCTFLFCSERSLPLPLLPSLMVFHWLEHQMLKLLYRHGYLWRILMVWNSLCLSRSVITLRICL